MFAFFAFFLEYSDKEMLLSGLFGQRKHVSFNPRLMLKKFSKTEAPAVLARATPVTVVVSMADEFALPMGRPRRRLRKSPAVRVR